MPKGGRLRRLGGRCLPRLKARPRQRLKKRPRASQQISPCIHAAWSGEGFRPGYDNPPAGLSAGGDRAGSQVRPDGLPLAYEVLPGNTTDNVHLPTTDWRKILLTRYTHPEPELQLVIDQLKLRLPPQPPPRITTAAINQPRRRSEGLLT
jgi:hypothetical protein